MAEMTDETAFGRLIVDKKLCTPDELQACRRHQKELELEGKRLTLQELMVKAGYLTRTQLQRLEQDMEDSMYRPVQQIPGFQILGRLGVGAMAKVFKARQLSLDRDVAIKILPRKLKENPEFVDRFYKEGKAAAKLNHNNIVQAIDVGEAGGYHYFVMELVDGKTVYDDLATGKSYSEKDALDIVIQVARALEHAHDRGLIHRDVKPKNIMLTKTGVAKLADMGLARETQDMEAAMAEQGRAYGTPYYISPEQIRGEVDIDARADIYSLGATFYHMVTGKVPFEGPTPAAVMNKHLKEPLVPPDHVNEKLSAGVGEVIEVMMAKRRKERYANVRELLVDLEAIARGEPPLIARRQTDSGVLEQIAARGKSIHVDRPATPSEAPSHPDWLWVIVLGAVLALSIILNIVLFVTRK